MLSSLTIKPISNQDPSRANKLAMTRLESPSHAAHGVVKQPEMGPTRSNNVGLHTPLLPTKRKAAPEPLTPNKRMVAHVNSPHQSGLSNKRMMRNDSMSGRTVSPRLQPSKSKTAPPEVSPKVQNESYEAIRMKMRESLAAALSVGNQGKEYVLNDKTAPQEAGSTAGEASGSTAGIQNSELTGQNEGEKPQYNYVMPDTDGDTFFVKDDLLQGNGLSWAWDMEVAELKEVQTEEKSNSVPVVSSPQELAVKIELQLFKLFGGVNKKYKEKGRSLMFNLKDRNNPELREKVLSSKITPERLCCMTPEELASKELSEWRMAKAEELDKMIVLPDSDVDMRRLVKKTHKGEYQVEVVDQDDDDGVSVGSISFTGSQKKMKTDQLSTLVEEFKVKDKVVNVSTDRSGIMQELIVDEFKDEGLLPSIVSLDEFMESLNSEPPFENLPLDGKETKAQSAKDNSDTGEDGNEKVASGLTSANRVEGEVNNNNINNNKPMVKTKEVLSSVKISENSAEPFSESSAESLWEGDLQLTISSTVPVIGVFKSGEKTSTKEWPGSMEIKGRVRLEAFEKFIQQLPMSRTRAIMIVHFVLNDASSEYHRACLSEAVDSYIAEERVGFGEPNPGVELYFCPPHKGITETLTKLFSKDQTEILKSPENGLIGGLIGVVVWRRAFPSSTLLHNSSSHHKHHRKHLSSRKQENKISNTNSNILSKSLCLPPQSNNGDDDDDDDVPPGFGPGVVARDEDDLPEFSFSKGSNSSGLTLPAYSGSGSRLTQSNLSPTPVAHMRQLVYEYGQTGSNKYSGIENRPWILDDDIPEWQPQIQNHHHPVAPDHSIQELAMENLMKQVRPPMGHIVNPIMHSQQPVNLMQNNWAQPPAPHGLLPNAALPGGYYGGQWRQDEPRGGGF